MKLKKKNYIICYLALLSLLSGCAQPTASLLGSVFTGAKTGNLYNAGLSFASNGAIKKSFGKTPAEYMADLLIQDSKTKKPNAVVNSEPHIVVIKERKPEIIKISIKTENDNNNYNEFLSSVKKILK